MFGKKAARIRELETNVRELEDQLRRALALCDVHLKRYDELAGKWNSLVRQVNIFGLGNGTSPQFTSDDIDRLIRLCHPDRHGGKQVAVEMTQKLLAMRGN
jgi:hypothetical protein